MLKKPMLILLLLFSGNLIPQTEWHPRPWPVLKHYDKDHLYQIALPVGGIGTGTVSVGGRGELRDWEIMNKPAKGFNTVTKGNNAPFFAIFVQIPDGKSITKALIGPLEYPEYQHYEGRPVNHHGLPRFTEATFDAAYPFGQVNLSDSNLPVKVQLKCFNPLIPTDADASGIPIAVLSYEVTNLSNQFLEVAVCGSMRNFVGVDGSDSYRDWKGDFIPRGAKNNINQFRESRTLKGIFMYSDSVDQKSAAWGTIALSTQAQDGVSYRTSSCPNHWENALLDFWDDFSTDGTLTEKSNQVDQDPMASLAVKQKIEPGAVKSFTFFITWNFPNRYAWSSEIVGNYYSTKYTDAWDVAEKTVPQLPVLEAKTLDFVNTFLESDFPPEVKEAALFNLSTLRSQTVFRVADGHLMGWEGVMDEFGSCHGSCTHVWNYEQATAFLFGDLARTMRDVEFNYASDPSGLMCFRASLPLSQACKNKNAAADGQMGCIMKFYRDWQLSGDNNFLKSNWDKIKNALNYAWMKGSWDSNQDGIMEGSQHNTMDVNYFGPNPQMGLWYLGALKAAYQMAQFMEDNDFARKCENLYKNGSNWIDKNLFNGEYYEHKITDPNTFAFLDWENNPDVKIPDFQLGKGCLVDQLVGQYMAHICGLGYLVQTENVQTTLKSIMKYNYRESYENHFNNMRSYVLGDESGLLMASWPKGRLKIPFPYFAETMTGFEYTAAVGMLYEGQVENGLKCIRNIRNRFDGRKRNPFDEPECGHHYARAMASWAAVLALSGFNYSSVDQSISFTSKNGKYFWSNGYAYGSVEITDRGKNKHVALSVNQGSIVLKSVLLKNFGKNIIKSPQKINEKQTFKIDIQKGKTR